jgi:hypothetical protein
MKDAYVQLQALRKNRERRAEARLIASQYALQVAQQQLEEERWQLAQAHGQIIQTADQLQGSLVAGSMACGDYRDAREAIELSRLNVSRQEHSIEDTEAMVATRRRARDAKQRLFSRRHRQVEGLAPWLEGRALDLLRARDAVEENMLEECYRTERTRP